VFGVSLIKGLLIIWAIVTSLWVALLIYRSTLGSHEDNQLFLGRPDNLLEHDQQEVVKRERNLAPFLYVLGTASAALLLSVVGVWLWRGLAT
jgi:hypothetical protein